MFEEEPDYTYLKQILRLLFRSMSYQYDYIFDWSSSNDPLVQEMIQYRGRRKDKGSRRTLERSQIIKSAETNNNEKIRIVD